MKRIGFIDGRRIAGWSFPATATPGSGQSMYVPDHSVGAVGTVAAQRVSYHPQGNKTGTSYSMAQAIDVIPHGDTYILRGQAIYFSTPGRAATIHQYFGQDIFMESLGPAVAVSEMAGISIGMNYTVATVSAASAMIRLYAHAAVFPNAIRLAGSGITNLFYFQRSISPVMVGAVGGAQNRKLRVHIADLALDYFIPLHTT